MLKLLEPNMTRISTSVPISRVTAVHAKGVLSCAYPFTQAPERLQTVEDCSKTTDQEVVSHDQQLPQIIYRL